MPPSLFRKRGDAGAASGQLARNLFSAVYDAGGNDE